MEDSFDEDEFDSLVNPSPTFKKKGKEVKRKPISRLALKKTLRRSSIYDKLPQSVENSNLNMVDAASTECSSNSSSVPPTKPVKPRKGFIILNNTASTSLTQLKDKKPADDIIINDSKSSSDSNNKSSVQVIEETDDEAEKVIPATAENSPVKNIQSPSKLNIKAVKQNDLLSETKFESIRNWVQSVAREDEIYSINTDCEPVKKPVNLVKTKTAVNSTFVMDKTCVPFDQWMKGAYKTDRAMKDLKKQVKMTPDKENKTPLPETPNQLMKKYLGSDVVKNLLIDDNSSNEKIIPTMTKSGKKSDDLIIIDDIEPVMTNKTAKDVIKKAEVKSRKTKSVGDKKKKNLLKTPKSKQIVESSKIDFKGDVANADVNDVVITPVKQMINRNDDVAKLLDTLYGNSWHKNKDLVFSEPRQPKKIQINKLKEPRTEKKPQRDLLYQNPYLDSEKQKSTSLLKSLQKQRIQANIESPFFARPKIVDDDTPSPGSNANNKTTRDSSNNSTENKSIESKDFISDSSDNELSLDDRLKKKHLSKPTKLSFTDASETKTSPILVKKPHRRIINISDSDSDSDSKATPDQGPVKSNTRKSSQSSSSTNSNHSDYKKPTRITKQKNKTDKNTDDLIDRIENITIDDPSIDSGSDSDDFIIAPKKGSLINKTKPPQIPKVHSFLASLSKGIPDELSDPSALIYKNNFKKHRDALTKKLFDMFNEKIFDKSIPTDTPIEWSVRMTGTAGLCGCMRRTHRDGKITRTVRLKLSTKVLDSADRLRDTLVHEMCHAATYLVNEVSDGHGRYWKAWAAKAMRAFPELPAITRCHSYAINHKYTYKCLSCGYSFGRHSKSLKIERKRCGYCYGEFEVLINKTGQGGDKKSVPCTPKKEPTGFAKFVKDNYALHRSPGVNHKDVMKLLGKKYAELKNDKREIQ